MTTHSRLLAGSLTIGLFVLCGVAKAQSAPRLPLAELTRCDATFFEAVAAQAEQLKALAPVKVRGTAATFDVPERQGEDVPTLTFSKPVVVEGLEVVGYYDDSLIDPGQLDTHFWGFVVKARPGEIARRFKSLIWDASRLRVSGEGAIVRTEIWRERQAADGFRPGVTQSGMPPQPGTIERVLFIEPRDEQITEFGCSLQGRKIPEAVLRSIRPDLAP